MHDRVFLPDRTSRGAGRRKESHTDAAYCAHVRTRRSARIVSASERGNIMYNKKINFRIKGIWIPSEILGSQALSASEKIALSLVAALDRDRGFFATNDYFAALLCFTPEQTERLTDHLVSLGCIRVSYHEQKRVLNYLGTEHIGKGAADININNINNNIINTNNINANSNIKNNINNINSNNINANSSIENNINNINTDNIIANSNKDNIINNININSDRDRSESTISDSIAEPMLDPELRRLWCEIDNDDPGKLERFLKAREKALAKAAENRPKPQSAPQSQPDEPLPENKRLLYATAARFSPEEEVRAAVRDFADMMLERRAGYSPLELSVALQRLRSCVRDEKKQLENIRKAVRERSPFLC